MAQYIWQHPQWRQGSAPAFTWQEETLRRLLEKCQQQQSQLLLEASSLSEQDQASQIDTLVQTALRTSEIEGETLDIGSVRSSVVRHLGLEQAGFLQGKDSSTPQTEALVTLLLEATGHYQQDLTTATLCQWQAALFPEPPLYKSILVGELRGAAPMQVISGRMDNPTIHFEAPPREGLEFQLESFLHWFNRPPKNLLKNSNPLLRAGISHLWLITLHPFDDGNGRVARAVTDRALAQAENNGIRYYSLSAAIMARRNEYYEQLEKAQKGDLDITEWLEWFLSVLSDAIKQGQHRFQRVVNKARFWQQHAQTPLTERQIKVLNRLLDTDGEEFTQGINASKYQALAKVSKATATRELADLLDKGCIVKLPGGGRSTRYAVAINR